MPARRSRGALNEIKKHEYYKILPPQLPNESDFDYILFAYYCFLGTDRSLKEASFLMAKLRNKEITDGNINVDGVIKNKSATYLWNDRAGVFDCTKVVQEIDKLIQVDAKLETEWVNKRIESRLILQKALTTMNKLLDGYSQLIDKGLSRLQLQRIPVGEYAKISRIFYECSSGIEKSVNIIRLVWEQKENIEALEAGRKVIEAALLN